MCKSIYYKGARASGQGELAKLIGDGDWKRGKAMICHYPGDDEGFKFNQCLCPIDVPATATKMGCVAKYDGCDWDIMSVDNPLPSHYDGASSDDA